MQFQFEVHSGCGLESGHVPLSRPGSWDWGWRTRFVLLIDACSLVNLDEKGQKALMRSGFWKRLLCEGQTRLRIAFLG